MKATKSTGHKSSRQHLKTRCMYAYVQWINPYLLDRTIKYQNSQIYNLTRRLNHNWSRVEGRSPSNQDLRVTDIDEYAWRYVEST